MVFSFGYNFTYYRIADMALHSGIDTVAYVCGGWYTSTYVTATGGGNIASLLASYGMLEEAPAPVISISGITSIILGKIKGMFLSEDIHI